MDIVTDPSLPLANKDNPEQALRGLATPYTTILEHMPEAFFALDTQWRITYLNHQAEPFLMKTKAELLGRNIWEAFPTAQDSLLMESCKQARSTGKASAFEHLVPNINRYFQVHVYPVEEGIYVYFHEITERKKLEERLRQSEKHFRALIENNPAGIALTDANGIIIYVSPSTTRLLGFLPEELVGHGVFQRLVYPRDREATECLLARVLQESGKSPTLEYRTQHKDGTFLWIAITGINLLHEPGVEAVVWNFRDVTEQKRLSEEVAKAKEQLEAILHNVSDGIVVVDTGGRIIYVNEVATKTLGFPSAEALLAAPRPSLGRLFSRASTWDEQGRPLPFEERPIVQALHGKTVQALLQYQDVLTTSQRHWILVKARPMVDAQGQVQFVVSVSTDLTEQKEFEQRKDHFISMASHELKTPLTILSAFTQLLQEQFAAEDKQDLVLHLSKMDDQITKLTRLVVDLLDISRIQADKLVLAQEVIDMNELVREVVENLQPTTTHHLLIEGAAQQTVIGDRDRLEQVLINLLTNAIKYSPQALAIFVRVAQTSDILTVSVQDFGIGIAQSHQERLFERFYRVYSEKDSTYPGLGIGLYIAREIIQRHGGTMSVESTEGKGSTFSFSLPNMERL